MRYYTVVFDHGSGKGRAFMKVKGTLSHRREQIERHFQKQGYKDVIMLYLHEFSSKEDYNEAEKILLESQS